MSIVTVDFSPAQFFDALACLKNCNYWLINCSIACHEMGLGSSKIFNSQILKVKFKVIVQSFGCHCQHQFTISI